MDDSISRRTAIDALWKALYDYEDKTEKQFQELKELDIGDQNMNDIDRKTILDLPSEQPEVMHYPQVDGITPCVVARQERKMGERLYKKVTEDFHVTGQCSVCKKRRRIDNFCPNCGADMRGDGNEIN